MRDVVLAFLVGCVWLQQLAALPSTTVLATGWACAAVIVAWLWRLRSTGALRRLAIALLALWCGFAWAAWRAELRLAEHLPREVELRDVTVTGCITDLPQRTPLGWRFTFAVETATLSVPHRVQLSWSAPRRTAEAAADAVPALATGECWQLTVRLRRPHGFSNPGGFDYEAWLLERGVRATGYVRTSPDNHKLTQVAGGSSAAINRLRERVRMHFDAVLGEAPYSALLAALAMGEQRAIPTAQWEVFRATGVAHLVSISGLHISLVAVLAGALAGRAWSLWPRALLWQPRRRVAALAAFVAAGAYAALAGFAVPAQRAWVMVAVVALTHALRREMATRDVLALALGAVLLLDPASVLAGGFWLSFGAVAAILLVAGGRLPRRRGWLWALHEGARVQLALALATLPALVLLFQTYPVLSPLANALAVPVVSFIVTPLVLLAIVVPWAWLLEGAHAVMVPLMAVLEFMAAQPFALWQQARPPTVLVIFALAACAWCLLPRGTPGKPAAAVLIVVPLLWSPPRPAPGEVFVTVLDLGQGLAVHVQTARHDLLFDAGPSYGEVADAGERVVVPYLRALGVRALDRLVLSHDDLDHVGGADSVRAALPVRAVLGSLPTQHRFMTASGIAAQSCTAGLAWEWDEVRFEVLHPANASAASTAGGDDNRASCVLRIDGRHGSALLTGDIDRFTEQRLLRQGAQVRADVVVVPHHGSRSSSSAAFVRATQARVALVSSGYRNRFNHPHPEVVSRWQAAGAEVWRTDAAGALRVELGAAGVRVDGWRRQHPRYWSAR